MRAPPVPLMTLERQPLKKAAPPSFWKIFLAINSTIIEFSITFLSRGHHKSSSDGIKWVGDNTSRDGNNLSESEEKHHVWLITQHNFTSIEETEVRGSVENDTNDGDSETLIESTKTILSEDLLEAINETVELSLSFWA